jgi:hypothetical protein
MSERVAVPTGPTKRQPTVPQIKAALRRLQTSVDRIDVEAVAAAARSRAEKAVRQIQAKVDLLTGQVDAAAASTAKTATAAERSRRYRPRRKGVGSIDTLGALEEPTPPTAAAPAPQLAPKLEAVKPARVPFRLGGHAAAG